MNLDDLKERVSAAFAEREKLKEPFYAMAVNETVALLDRGVIRVAQKAVDGWEVNAWVKEAILLYFSLAEMKTMELPPYEFFDRIPLKKGLAEAGVRVVPTGTASGVGRTGPSVTTSALGLRGGLGRLLELAHLVQ